MATRKTTPSGYSDDTGPRIRAYLDSLEPLDSENLYGTGLRIVERLAASAEGTEPPTMQLSLADCEDVLYLLQTSMPENRREAFTDPKDSPSHVCGYYSVLNAIAEGVKRARETPPADAIPSPAPPPNPLCDGVAAETIDRAQRMVDFVNFANVQMEGKDPCTSILQGRYFAMCAVSDALKYAGELAAQPAAGGAA